MFRFCRISRAVTVTRQGAFTSVEDVSVSDRCWNRIAAVNALESGKRMMMTATTTSTPDNKATSGGGKSSADLQQQLHQQQQRFLRMSVESGGCKGFLYKFSFDDKINDEEDFVIHNDAVELDAAAKERLARDAIDKGLTDVAAGVSSSGSAASSSSIVPTEARVVIDAISLSKIKGATLDYHSELKGAAFVVIGNQLVDEACSCGLSFAVKS